MDHPSGDPRPTDENADNKQKYGVDDDDGGGDVPSDLVEIGTLSGLGGVGGFLSRNASPYSSMRDLRIQPTAASTLKATTPTQSNSNLKKQRKRDFSNYNDDDDDDHNNNNNASSSAIMSTYGAPITVTTTGNFPAIGSTLGPYFSIGRLGKGTFCSIHKCINLHYFHDGNNNNNNNKKKIPRLAAAKVEIGEFINSGILGGEASILHFLHSVLPDHTVPVYMGHYQASAVDGDTNIGGSNPNKNMTTAIVMEYLPGQDMHVIRDWATRQQQQQQGLSSSSRNNSNRLRRIAVQDAVFLTAHVMLPLLQRMHSVGIVHRDVKPSNVVKCAETATSQDFCVVDFGLSKSIVVPSDSSLADVQHLWHGKDWMKTTTATTTMGTMDSASGAATTTSGACYRKERESADFRGTSMYASVPVHQLHDYSPRDDVWSLLYVFCDLVSGGLPWMSHAASRNRVACQKLKERIHGMAPQADGKIRTDTKRLLMGDDYHVELYKKYKGDIDIPEENQDTEAGTEDETLPQPLALSNDSVKVQLLERAFEHLKQLKFTDMPDYDLIRQCLEGFLDGSEESNIRNANAPPIDWKALSTSFRSRVRDHVHAETALLNTQVPTWDFEDADDKDPLELEDSNMFAEADFHLRNTLEEDNGDPLYGEAADLARLPIEMRYRIAQMDYNTSRESTIAPHLALRDWFKVALPLLYGTWDSAKYEKGGHRFNEDGYRRECYLRVVEKCIECASAFKDFRNRECFYHSKISEDGEPKPKRRNIISTMCVPKSHTLGSDLIALSKVAFELRMVQKAEEVLPRAPPPRLTFGS